MVATRTVAKAETGLKSKIFETLKNNALWKKESRAKLAAGLRGSGATLSDPLADDILKRKERLNAVKSICAYTTAKGKIRGELKHAKDSAYSGLFKEYVKEKCKPGETFICPYNAHRGKNELREVRSISQYCAPRRGRQTGAKNKKRAKNKK